MVVVFKKNASLFALEMLDLLYLLSSGEVSPQKNKLCGSACTHTHTHTHTHTLHTHAHTLTNACTRAHARTHKAYILTERDRVTDRQR